METRRRKTWFLWTALALGVAVLAWFKPLFHVVPLLAARQQSVGATFNAAVFVEKFWNERLLKSPDQAVDAATLLAEFQKDSRAAREKYGRTLGLSSTRCYFVAGNGRVVAVEKNSISLTLERNGRSPDIIIETGNVFGNATRDGTGLLNVNDFPNSQDFNAISSEINRHIEERVLPGLRSNVVVGATLRFEGCTEISNQETDPHPLRLVPLIAEVQ